MADDTMTDDEARKFFDELPEWVDVPMGDGEVVKVHKRKLTGHHLDLIIADHQRREAENLELLGAEALRRGCRGDQPMGEVFPEGTQVALARLRAERDGRLQ
jgi:hypothetical protein